LVGRSRGLALRQAVLPFSDGRRDLRRGAAGRGTSRSPSLHCGEGEGGILTVFWVFFSSFFFFPFLSLLVRLVSPVASRDDQGKQLGHKPELCNKASRMCRCARAEMATNVTFRVTTRIERVAIKGQPALGLRPGGDHHVLVIQSRGFKSGRSRRFLIRANRIWTSACL
jgi:hypothetical protein